jgi:hypothetical protein
MFLQILIILLVAGLALWGALRLIAATPALLKDVKPCRGNWAEARLRHCERGLAVTGIPVEPFNTFSNLAYFAAAWVLVNRFGTMPATILAGSLTLLGVGSGLYHGTKAMWAARVDHAGMYAVFGALALYCVMPPHPLAVYVMLGGVAAFAIGFALVAPGDLNARMGLLLGLVSVRGFLLGRTTLSAIGLGLFVVAYIVWSVDQRSTVLNRFGHAIWHVCTAAAIAVMFAAVAT